MDVPSENVVASLAPPPASSPLRGRVIGLLLLILVLVVAGFLYLRSKNTTITQSTYSITLPKGYQLITLDELGLDNNSPEKGASYYYDPAQADKAVVKQFIQQQKSDLGRIPPGVMIVIGFRPSSSNQVKSTASPALSLYPSSLQASTTNQQVRTAFAQNLAQIKSQPTVYQLSTFPVNNRTLYVVNHLKTRAVWGYYVKDGVPDFFSVGSYSDAHPAAEIIQAMQSLKYE